MSGRARRALTAAAVVVLMWGCSHAPRVERSRTRAIYGAAHGLLLKYPAVATIDSSAWPESVRELEPVAVRSREEGLYIVTWSHFVEENGVFVPRHWDRFSPKRGSDPEYRLIANAVFSYRIRG